MGNISGRGRSVTWGKRMSHSVESRFIAIISAALLVVVAPLFTLFLALSSQQAVRNLNEHINVVLDTNSQALAKPLWDLDTDSVRQVAATLITDPMIKSVRIVDTTGQLDVATNEADLPENLSLATVSKPISYNSNYGVKKVGTITVSVPVVGWFSTLHDIEFAFISIFVIAILTVFGAAILGNRVMVIKPLLRLTAAIEATRRLGSRHHVDWRSNDEMGRLARSFNEMQALLEREEKQLKQAHQQTTEIYRHTPAMLFTLSNDDRIAAVSDYWVLATGHQRADVLTRPFADLIVPEDRAHYLDRKRANQDVRTGGGMVLEVTVGFACADGRVMDVLIGETNLTSAAAPGGSLNVMTDVTELRRSELRNHQQAISDHLTGLLNRQGFEAALEAKIADADRQHGEIACLFVDLDRFKAINDNLGHAAGDEVLKQFVLRLQDMLQPIETASRLGGDEFAILLSGESAQQRGEDLAKRIVDIFETPFEIDGSGVRLSASIGIAFYPHHATSGADLLQKSDLAMYARKREGRNGAHVYNPAMLDKTRERAEIESDIEVGIAASWFEAHFQPIVETGSGIPIGFEALMRMRHPRKGILSPAGIIAVAEETGTIDQIGNLVLEDAMANLSRISRLPGMADTYVAVNFSPLQFEAGLPGRLGTMLSRYAIRPERLVVEITEAVLMHDNPEIRTILEAIHELGCRIALDDFGTGYSSLSYMSRFPVDIVKIDQSFVRGMADEAADVARRNRMLVEGINAISHKMNCKVIAEGVETENQLAMLQEIGVDCAQGYHFSRPREIGDLYASLQREHVPLTSMAS